QVYSKKYLHGDEEGFFVSGPNIPMLEGNKTGIALAICYEISVPGHSENAFKNGAGIYIASVAKSVPGVANAIDHLSGIANKYSMAVFMSNCVGYCDNFECGGKSSVWNDQGTLIGQLNEKNEGILILDIETKEIIEEILY
ncbi:MAG TPA: nitrilase-related carbon-nitrogen hydrolase, partial [Chitinophagaceae bacterium]|nr:nitrilase-related carbon-nitrogen hydrolase [Chitinophagaceae bacterium]